MNLFDFTYCGNYNRQIQCLARMAPEKWSFGEAEDNGISLFMLILCQISYRGDRNGFWKDFIQSIIF